MNPAARSAESAVRVGLRRAAGATRFRVVPMPGDRTMWHRMSAPWRAQNPAHPGPRYADRKTRRHPAPGSCQTRPRVCTHMPDLSGRPLQRRAAFGAQRRRASVTMHRHRSLLAPGRAAKSAPSKAFRHMSTHPRHRTENLPPCPAFTNNAALCKAEAVLKGRLSSGGF